MDEKPRKPFAWVGPLVVAGLLVGLLAVAFWGFVALAGIPTGVHIIELW